MSDTRRTAATPSHDSHNAVVTGQFGPQASAYLTSANHAQGADLEQLASIARAHARAQVLDLGCGAGHVSFFTAPHVARVVAYDLSADMLGVVAGEAAKRGLKNIDTQLGAAESLPFDDASFDLVFSRYSAHHWADVGAALREMRRVLKPGGRVAICDVASTGQPLFDTYLQAVEVLRDTSHVRDYSTAEWLTMAAGAGFSVASVTPRTLELDFKTWTTRMRTPEPMQVAIRALQTAMADSVREHFRIQNDGSFTLDTVTLELIAG
ncbi:class I SAM-dependent methyltransferase [Pandoraea capi]|uniref:class I SAM-dependent methyltransferase n=1 Tax=Pandoraea TaxID=93217 RepID=UPI001F5C7BFD|nr:class I SAM-dependent methyltransferase [Pandoraea capi]MCI3204909.1 SAM-dependent methyltransferase [Pandoraea sp. LA3]MDN4582937.1 SAM-dependent methyltransferase [Pandoraea capi]